jgi:hypothetical protein
MVIQSEGMGFSLLTLLMESCSIEELSWLCEYILKLDIQSEEV